MQNTFLDISAIRNKDVYMAERYNVQRYNIKFVFPTGFAELRLIEECRALNCLDLENPDNFDFMFDITMQMITGKPVFVYYIDDKDKETLIGKFIVSDRYMNLRTVDIIDEYPVLVNWLVEFIAGTLAKKYPRSLLDIQARMSEREERMKSLLKSENQVKMGGQIQE